MRKNKLLLVLLVLAAGKLFATDMTIIAGAGNFSFDTSRKTSMGGTENFQGNFFPFGLINIKDQITDTYGYSATLERDPLLRNVLSCEMTINAGILNVSVGPLFSMFNSWEAPILPGISTSLGLEFPGIFFINLRSGATLGNNSQNEHGLETIRVALGFWLPNLLSTFSYTSSKFNEKTDSVDTRDELVRFAYRADIHAKNVPYTVSIDMGYQSLKREYHPGKDIIRAVFLGIEADITVMPNITFILGAETPVFVWGKAPLKRAKGQWYYQVFAGFTWKIQKENDFFFPQEEIAEE